MLKEKSTPTLCCYELVPYTLFPPAFHRAGRMLGPYREAVVRREGVLRRREGVDAAAAVPAPACSRDESKPSIF